MSNKILKKLLVKYDEYNESKLDDFIAFNRYALDDQFSINHSSILQGLARIAVIKTVDVTESIIAEAILGKWWYQV